MRKCPVCEGLLPNSRFEKGESICRICKAKIKNLETIEFGQPGHRTIRQAYFSLVIAIRDRAIIDGELEDWKEHWLYREPWCRIWELLKKAEEDRCVSESHTKVF